MNETPLDPRSSAAAPLGRGAPVPKKKWPWVLGGCGCLILLLIVAGVAAAVFFGFGSAEFTPNNPQPPAAGHMTDILPAELTSGSTTFKLTMRDTSTSETPHFRYSGRTAAGTTTEINGWMSRLASPAEAATKLKETAEGYTRSTVTLQPKGSGQRFSGKMWSSSEPVFGWTSGSLMFVIYPDSDESAREFEKAATF